jgi:hypothetical protein
MAVIASRQWVAKEGDPNSQASNRHQTLLVLCKGVKQSMTSGSSSTVQNRKQQ